MNRIFAIEEGGGFPVPDGTIVFPFLNPKDSTSGLPWNLLEGMSIAAGDIPTGKSKIHVHLHVTHVTFVLKGTLTVWMKDLKSSRPYERKKVQAQEAVLAEPGTFQQFMNTTRTTCRVLYLVSPAFLFEGPPSNPKYNDAIVFEETWEQLAAMKWKPPQLHDPKHSKKAREACYQRLARLKSRIK